MKCQDIEKSMDQLPPSGRVPSDLLGHLADCSDCEEAVKKWQLIQRTLQALERQNAPARRIPLNVATERLISRAAKEHERRRAARRLAIILPIAASFALIAATSIYVAQLKDAKDASHQSPDSDRQPPQMATLVIDGETRTDHFEQISRELEAPRSKRSLLQINDDAVGIEQDSRVRIERARPEQTRLRLDQGRIACQVTRRALDERFEVQAGPFLVRVTGTQFSVSRQGTAQLTVAVWEGEVQVARGAEQWAVEKGTRLVLGETKEPLVEPLSTQAQGELERLLKPNADETQSPALGLDAQRDDDEQGKVDAVRPARRPTEDLATLRAWVLDGRYEKARRSLRRHLRAHPEDAKAWSLLSDCARKMRRWDEAVAAYREIIAIEVGAKKRRAQYRAGTIYQDQLADPAAAAKLFEQYLASDATASVIKAEAMVRLARAYLDMGRRAKAKTLLETVHRVHKGTAAAAEAKKKLESMNLDLDP